MNQFAARGAVSRIFVRPNVPRRALRISAIMTKKDPHEVISDFRSHVNMSVKELQDWLETDKSQEIGWNPEGGESKVRSVHLRPTAQEGFRVHRRGSAAYESRQRLL